MNIAKRALMFLGSALLVAALVSVVAPKATHALVATLVQVTNTPASPVPNRDVDLPDRAIIQYLPCGAVSSPGVNGVGCDPGFSVPAGQRFVIQQLETKCTAPKGNNIYGAQIVFVEAGFGDFHPFALISQGDGGGQVEYAQNQQVHYYADAGSNEFTFSANTTDTSGNTNCYFALSGYLISYP